MALSIYKHILTVRLTTHGGSNIAVNISKQIIELLKAYIDGMLDRETLNLELRIIRSKIFETQKNLCDEQILYFSIIQWIALTVPEHAYNEDEIRYVYKALMGEKGYHLRYAHWIPTLKDECDETEQQILEISQNYINNYENNTQFLVFNDQASYLPQNDIEFILSMYTNELTRNEFGEVFYIRNVFFRCLLDLLKIGSICHSSLHHDTNRYVMEKIKYYLSLYNANVPFCCNALLQNGIPTFILY